MSSFWSPGLFDGSVNVVSFLQLEKASDSIFRLLTLLGIINFVIPV